ncbi:GntP family permease [Clostridium sp. AM58-1XD]|uniref:GntP family permease n=1 Tax=Clostridium sp. AM58-1XD TaxID=2292307 RepID=UPI000E552412|nr:GntP family permease [Clostridium sp. AM58-1XD]RGY99602.1 GntP family permease [Clostridium sp. AM58-1XD]
MQTIIIFLVGLAIMLFLMIKTKLGPFMSMLFGGLIIGIGCGVGTSETISTITGGFGSTCKSIGLVIIFGTILGTYLEKSNACQRIATSLLKLTGEKNASVALGATGFLVSIPVFSDVALIMLSPIIKAISKKTGKVVCVLATLTASALLCTNAYVAPTPAPLAVVAVLGVDVGTSIVYGLVVAAVSTVAAWVFCMMFMDKKPAGYFTGDEGREEKEAVSVSEDQMPTFLEAILPILLPIVLIIANSVCSMILPEDSAILMVAKFIGDKNIALVVGIISAVMLLKKKLPQGETFTAMNDALKTAGPVIFITAAGGALAKVVDATGTGQIFADALAASPLPVICIPFLITALSKFAQGSGSVAALLGASLTLPLIEAGLIDPVVAFISISAGSHCGSHVNNSFFWVFAEFFGYDTKTTLKTLCVSQNVVLAGSGLLCAFAVSLIR